MATHRNVKVCSDDAVLLVLVGDVDDGLAIICCGAIATHAWPELQNGFFSFFVFVFFFLPQ